MGSREDEDLALSRRSENEAAIKAGEAIEKHRGTPKTVTGLAHGQAFVILRDGGGSERVEWVSQQFINPTFRAGTVKLDDAASFIAYVNRHGTDNSAVYAKMSPAKFVAVLDEHPPTTPVSAAVGTPQWREFRAEFTPTLSKEWDVWTKRDRQAFETTEKFAYFLEDNLPDVTEPAGAEMLELALNFRVHQDVRFSAAQRLQDGHAEITFQNLVDAEAQNSAGGKIQIPEKFKIKVPVFAGVGAPMYEIEARFRWRLKANEGLKLWYELVRPQKVLEQAFEDLWKGVGDGTKKVILLGTPE